VVTKVLPVHSYESFARIIFKIMLKAFATFALPIVICIAVIVEPAFPQTPTEAPRPLGKMIDLGGYRLHLDCEGKGSPIVILSSGGGGFSTDWALVQSKAAAFTRVCSYDRSGAAWSDLGPKPRTKDQEAFDLHRLMIAAGESGPYVLVGQSMGGMVARIFTQNYPKDVVGLILVDALSEDAQLSMNGAMHRVRLLAKARTIPAPRTNVTPADAMTSAEMQEKEAIVKKYMSNPKIEPPYDRLPDYAQRVRLWALKQPKNYAEDDDYLAEITAREYALDQTEDHPLDSILLIVLTRDKSRMNDYQGPQAASLVQEHEEQQARMAKLSSHGKQIIVPNAGHQIELEAPETVVSAVRDIATYKK
jgi:pimeloyl-ACP methyl ester carboxylesterase